MAEKISDKVSLKIVEWLADVGNILKDEVPQFVTQVATYGFWMELIWSLFWASMCLVFFRLGKKFFKKAAEYKPEGTYDDWDTNFRIWACVFSGLSFLFGLFSLADLSCAIKAHIAPVLYVIDRFTR